ncbi:hypothetical protein SPFM8_00041 [Salmonella phage SPFM8]|nr:hypothetical protein SPFM8_00041 [Salmonella phage SPFM8]
MVIPGLDPDAGVEGGVDPSATTFMYRDGLGADVNMSPDDVIHLIN